MTQLSYNEAFDPYHAAFRAIWLLKGCKPPSAVPFDKVRIVDFYLLFPFRVQNLSLMADDVSWRTTSRKYEWMIPYGGMPDDNTVFGKMEPFQRAAISSLARAGYVDVDSWRGGNVLLTTKAIPRDLEARINQLSESMHDILPIICKILNNYPLLGPDGLKKRSKLMEHRYDAI